jgi:hypothetical protein
MRQLARVVVLVLLLCGCGASEEQQRLDRTFAFATHQLRAVSRDLLASIAYQDTLEQGATPLNYIVAAAPENADFSALVWQGPIAPWTVVIKEGPGESELVVEAYGETTGQPARSETIDLTPKPRQ